MTDHENNVPEHEYEPAEEQPAEYIELEAADAKSEDKVKDLRNKLKACQAEKSTHLEELQRTRADFLNAKKRLEEQRLSDAERARVEFISSLLPLCDSFDMALGDSAVWESVDENWRKGVEGIKSQLDAILKQHQVTSFGTSGEPFDPERHEAMSTTDAEQDSDTIVEVLQKGYERNGSVIRPAKVIIQS